MRHKRTSLLKITQLFRGSRLAFLISFVLIFLGVYVAFYTPILLVQTVEATTEYQDINIEELRQTVGEKVVNQNALTMDLHGIEMEIYERFPDISALNCDRHLFTRSITCEVIGYELVAVVKNLGERYYINENGVVITFDNRKIGLPIFDLVLNPVYADLEPSEASPLSALQTPNPLPFGPELTVEGHGEPTPPALVNTPLDPSSGSLTGSILLERARGVKKEDNPQALDPQPITLNSEQDAITFISPFDAPPVEPVIKAQREVFDIVVGKKILDPEELKKILDTIKELEKVLGRKVIHVQYVQVAAELSLTSRPQTLDPEPSTLNSEPSTLNPEPSTLNTSEAPDHEFTIFLDLRRNLEDQFTKLKKVKEVIDFSIVERIDLSIDGEKVFYK